jgi:hypothetical protein
MVCWAISIHVILAESMDNVHYQLVFIELSSRVKDPQERETLLMMQEAMRAALYPLEVPAKASRLEVCCIIQRLHHAK